MFSFRKNKGVLSNNELMAFLSGEVVPIDKVPDQIFSQKILGDGLAIIPQDNVVLAPANGEISVVMADTKHAIGIHLSNGMEILIHVGLDTVDMNGEGFELFVKEGSKIKTGDPVIKFDPDKITAAGHSTITIMVITEQAADSKITIHSGMQAKAGETCILSIE